MRMVEVIKNIFWGSDVKNENDETKKPRQEVGYNRGSQRNNILTNKEEVMNPRLEIGNSGESQGNLMINKEINKTPVTSGRPASIVKENLWNTVEEGDENPAGE